MKILFHEFFAKDITISFVLFIGYRNFHNEKFRNMYGFSGLALCFNAITWNNIHLPARNNPVYKCFSLNDTFLISKSEKKIFQNGGRFFTYFVEIYIEKILVSFVFQTNLRKNAIVPWNILKIIRKFFDN